MGRCVGFCMRRCVVAVWGSEWGAVWGSLWGAVWGAVWGLGGARVGCVLAVRYPCWLCWLRGVGCVVALPAGVGQAVTSYLKAQGVDFYVDYNLPAPGTAAAKGPARCARAHVWAGTDGASRWRGAAPAATGPLIACFGVDVARRTPGKTTRAARRNRARRKAKQRRNREAQLTRRSRGDAAGAAGGPPASVCTNQPVGRPVKFLPPKQRQRVRHPAATTPARTSVPSGGAAGRAPQAAGPAATPARVVREGSGMAWHCMAFKLCTIECCAVLCCVGPCRRRAAGSGVSQLEGVYADDCRTGLGAPHPARRAQSAKELRQCPSHHAVPTRGAGAAGPPAR